jgi:hypothetical protein
MVRMSNEQLNRLLQRAVESLQDDRATLITYSFADPTKPLLPEGYWRDQHDRATRREADAAADAAAQLFEDSLRVVHARNKRRQEDERLANMSVDDLLDDVPTLWEPDAHTSWGSTSMKVSGGTLRPPTQGPQAPSYNFECYQCGRPITERNQNYWVDHSGDTHCDGALMLDVEFETWHMPKPFHGEEEDEDA